MKTPLIPLDQDQKRLLAADCQVGGIQTGTTFRAISILWLHFCLELGLRPADTRARDSANHRKVLKAWVPVSTKLTGVPSNILSDKWARDAATHAAQLYQKALQERADETAPALPLLAAE